MKRLLGSIVLCAVFCIPAVAGIIPQPAPCENCLTTTSQTEEEGIVTELQAAIIAWLKPPNFGIF